MNILISGDAQYNDWNIFTNSLRRLSFFQHPAKEIRILSCHNGETDHMAERFAGLHKWQCLTLPLQTESYGRDSLLFRNSELAQITDGAVIFWDGKNKDTEYLLKILKMSNRPFVLFDYYGNVKENFVPVLSRQVSYK